ncbi:helix-turn-helix domain-containing protein [Atopomonas sediminilitoris]|uniref:helix-turn-helix domain-containing protein n=1 Tax=Atopomonas sediminilitoris TaxID=2919919 RepID=UPI001F4E526C|nr:helix-turn-helix transcriptional regulator [Atopomonas sediminilitoris]MCJ8170098.1 helix-turn-helix domain-containing protein [Atopomonas sediminilitoris]
MQEVQIIARDGVPEYAVLPWAQYQALLQAAGQLPAAPASKPAAPSAQGQSLTQLREALGLSIEALAREVGISPLYLQMFESGERPLEGAIRSSLARKLNVSEESLP